VRLRLTSHDLMASDTMANPAAVIGAGVMGCGIAQVLATAGWSVYCFDTNAATVEEARDRIQRGRFGFERAVARGKLTSESATEALERLSFESSLEAAVTDCEIVIEAIPEDLGEKVRLFRELDRLAPEGCVLASNTSGLPIAALAAATNRPEAVIGWHWASPAQVQRLAEIVVAPTTSQATVDQIVTAAQRCGKNPIVVTDHPRTWGFVVNRILASAFATAQSIVNEGVATPDQVDALLNDAFGWESGLFGITAGAASGWS
jgi:3-hydroxybutyryl-CoA dehydrogenase